MGKRANKERDRRRRRLAPAPHAPFPPPPNGMSPVDFVRWLGHCGVISVLFETPSGFAILHYSGVKLFLPKAVEDIWSEFITMSTAHNVIFFKEFKIFKDKACAIKSNGVCSELTKMIKSSLQPVQKLAVGKQEYKDIIEANLGIHCLFDEAVLELMWGLKNLIKDLVPEETLELSDEDRLQISRGMKSVLDRYDFEVDANLVNSDIIGMSSSLYECDLFEDERAPALKYGSEQLQKVSGFDSKNWNGLKLATALTLICCPEDTVVTGDSEEMLSNTEAEQLLADAHRYEDKFHKYSEIYRDMVWVQGLKRRALELLGSMVKEARQDGKLHQWSMVE
uniref:Uncharacterized protein n=1 Tax=Avena sativa TaxID=4498 RepID=A0ACD5ZWT0_AVESA